MGSGNSKAEQLHFDLKDWQEVQRSTIYEVMRSNRGQQANLYHFTVKSQRDLDDEIELYFKRRSAANWVQVLGADISSSGFGFCGSQDHALVLTERIPYILNEFSRLNKQDSLVVLYNALRGYNDISKLIVPHSITDKMIAFTKEGQTKVWINENFGMNYPSHFVEDAVLVENEVIKNLVNVIVARGELNPDFVSTLKSSNSFNTALGFVRSNGGVPENILEANRINVQTYNGKTQVPILKDTTQVTQAQIVQSQAIPIGFTPAPQYSFQTGPSQNYTQSWVPPQSSNFQQPVYRGNSVQFSTPGTSSNFTYKPTYQPVQQPSYQPSSNLGYNRGQICD